MPIGWSMTNQPEDCDFCETPLPRLWNCGDYWLCRDCLEWIDWQLKHGTRYECENSTVAEE